MSALVDPSRTNTVAPSRKKTAPHRRPDSRATVTRARSVAEDCAQFHMIRWEQGTKVWRVRSVHESEAPSTKGRAPIWCVARPQDLAIIADWKSDANGHDWSLMVVDVGRLTQPLDMIHLTAAWNYMQLEAAIVRVDHAYTPAIESQPEGDIPHGDNHFAADWINARAGLNGWFESSESNGVIAEVVLTKAGLESVEWIERTSVQDALPLTKWNPFDYSGRAYLQHYPQRTLLVQLEWIQHVLSFIAKADEPGPETETENQRDRKANNEDDATRIQRQLAQTRGNLGHFKDDIASFLEPSQPMLLLPAPSSKRNNRDNGNPFSDVTQAVIRKYPQSARNIYMNFIKDGVSMLQRSPTLPDMDRRARTLHDQVGQLIEQQRVRV